MDWIEILLVVLQTLGGIFLGYLGVHATVKPSEKFLFIAVGIGIALFSGQQAYRGNLEREAMRKQLPNSQNALHEARKESREDLKNLQENLKITSNYLGIAVKALSENVSAKSNAISSSQAQLLALQKDSSARQNRLTEQYARTQQTKRERFILPLIDHIRRGDYLRREMLEEHAETPDHNLHYGNQFDRWDASVREFLEYGCAQGFVAHKFVSIYSELNRQTDDEINELRKKYSPFETVRNLSILGRIDKRLAYLNDLLRNPSVCFAD